MVWTDLIVMLCSVDNDNTCLSPAPACWPLAIGVQQRLAGMYIERAFARWYRARACACVVVVDVVERQAGNFFWTGWLGRLEDRNLRRKKMAMASWLLQEDRRSVERTVNNEGGPGLWRAEEEGGGLCHICTYVIFLLLLYSCILLWCSVLL